MRLRNLDLILIAIIALLNVIAALLPIHLMVIGIVFALPLVFFLPGYILTEAFFHNGRLDRIHRFILNLGLSLAMDILGGFILNIFPIGLRAASWGVFLGLLTTLFSLLVMYLRPRSSFSGIRMPRFHFRVHEYILFGLAIVVAILSIQYSAIETAQQPRPGFTQLWMLPAKSNSCQIRIGIQSFESASVTYHVVMTVNGTQLSTWSSIVLVPQQKWNQSTLIKPSASSAIYIETQLYRADKPKTVYREVHMTLNNLGRWKDRKTLC